MNSKKISIDLKALYIASFGALACFLPFLTYYFQSVGLSYTQIGIAFAVYSITGVLTQPIWGFITDKYLNKRITIIITMVASAATIYSLIFAKTFPFIIFSMILFLIFQSSIIPVTDAYTYEIIEKHNDIQYGRIRLMGSLGYAVLALVCGIIIKNAGISSAFILYSVMILLGALIIYKMNFKGKSSTRRADLGDISKVLKDKRFIILMLSIFIANISLGSNTSYISLLIQATGGDVSVIGLLGFTLAASEVPVLFIGTKLLKKHGELNIYATGMFFFAVRYFLDSISISYVTVILIQTMQAVTYSLFLISTLEYICRITPAKIRTSALTFYTAVCGSGAFIGNIGGGILLEHINIFGLYKIIALICLASTAVILVLKNVEKSYVVEKSIKSEEIELNLNPID